MNHRYRTRIQGEGLQEKIRDIEFNVYETMIIPAFFVMLTILLWLFCLDLKWIKFNTATAIIYTIVTLFFIIRAFRKVKALRKSLNNYRKGLEGERLVGEVLNKLSNDNTFIFHDIPGDRFNVDHIIVSTRGVFVIETKHFDRSKCHEFIFDGNMIYRQMKDGARYLCPKLLPQMDGEAKFIQNEIENRTEMKIPIIKVAVLIGCFIHTPAENDSNQNMKKYFSKYWIVNEKLLSSMFLEEKEIYDDSVVKLIASHIKELVKIDIDK